MDCWSDVDLLVACEETETTKWLAAEAIRAAKPVAFFREFTAAEQPSGRYWFADEFVFHRLDISFHTLAEHASDYRDCPRLGSEFALRELYRCPVPSPTTPPAAAPQTLLISAREAEVGSWIHRLHNSLKAHLRGESREEEVTLRACGLRDALGTTGPEAVGGGGRIGWVAYQYLEVAARALGTPASEWAPVTAEGRASPTSGLCC